MALEEPNDGDDAKQLVQRQAGGAVHLDVWPEWNPANALAGSTLPDSQHSGHNLRLQGDTLAVARICRLLVGKRVANEIWPVWLQHWVGNRHVELVLNRIRSVLRIQHPIDCDSGYQEC